MCLKVVLNSTRKNYFSTVGGTRYDFRSFLKIKLNQGKMGIIRPRLVCLINLKLVWRPLIGYKNLALKGHFSHFRSNMENPSNWSCSLTFQNSKILGQKNNFSHFRGNIKNLVHRLHPNVQLCPECATVFWAICVLSRVSFVQHSGRISIPKWQKSTEMG